MAEHEPSVGGSDDWYTPRSYFNAINLTFALDPCSPGPSHWVPARKVYTKNDDGLSRPWGGPNDVVFMNPPFGGRHGHVPWLLKFLNHNNGVAIVRAYTSADWWHDHVATRAHAILFPRGKTQFVRGRAMQTKTRKGEVIDHPAGSIGNSPGHGVALIGMGTVCCDALQKSRLGWFVDQRGVFG